MSKNKSEGVGGDRKEGISGEAVPSRIITYETAVSGLPPLCPNPSLQPTGQAYVVHSYHEMKNFSKSTRPIAPAPPTIPNLAARNLQSSQENISSTISQSLSSVSNDSIISLNLLATTASSGLGKVTHNPLAVPVTLSQASVLQLGSNLLAGSSAVVQQSISGSALPVAMLRGSNVGQQAQPQNQTFTSSFSHLPRGTLSPVVAKTTGLLRQGTSSVLQTPTGLNALPLPIARPPLIQSFKTVTVPATRPQMSAIGGQTGPQVQPQDLSRTNFAMHSPITPMTSGNLSPISMHVTLNRINTPVNQDGTSIQPHTVSSHTQNDTTVHIQQRISVPLSSDSVMHPRLTPDLGRSTLPFSGSTKLSQPNLGSTAKIISAHQRTPIKPVNIAVTTPIVINSMNPSQTTAITTVATTPIPVAKVTPQRHLPVGSIPSSPVPILQSYAASSTSSSSAASTPLSVPHTSMPVFSLPSSSSAISSSNVVEAGSIRHEQTGIVSTQASSSSILIASDFQSRPPGSIITMTTMASPLQGGNAPLVVSHADNRSNGQSQQQFDVKPEDSMWLQHYVFQAQTPQVSQSTQMIRPGTNTFTFLPSQGPNSNLATNQLSAMSVVPSSNVRFSSGPVLVMDHLRQQQQQQQQQHPLHSTFNTSTTTVGGTNEKTAANLLSRGVMASSMYTASAGFPSQTLGVGGTANLRDGLSSVPVTNANSSPRPSILRKRPSEMSGVAVRKPIFNLNQDTRCLSPPRIDTHTANICSAKISVKNFSPLSENSQSSTDTALSSNDATTPTHNHRKTEGDECLENGSVLSTPIINNIPASPAVSHTGSLLEASPRKRARKQLLHVSEELKDNMTSSEDELENNTHYYQEESFREHKHKDREIRGEYTDDEGVRWILNKPKPTYVLLQPDLINNKTRHNHFTRYSDIKTKEERWPTVNELSNQRGIVQKVNGWKLYFSASQLEELMEVEKDIQEQFAEIQAALAQIPSHKINCEETLKIHEMSQANIQRCQLIQSQLTDARATMIRTLEHKSRIQEIVNKHMSKRPIKKKERT